ncbi:hypothetical protein C8J34_104133 [Rhizobium sp. PP-F2F-G36]|nr:hypothetical protein C8J34_104133 [Rhizobium sp. PP-F2F-G36]
MTAYRWKTKDGNTSCNVVIKGSRYHLYTAVAPGRQGEAFWAVRLGGEWGQLIAANFAPSLGHARARAEFYAERWAENVWGLYLGDGNNSADRHDLAG